MSRRATLLRLYALAETLIALSASVPGASPPSDDRHVNEYRVLGRLQSRS